FGKRGECFHALRFVLNRPLHECHRDALGRALGEIRHECFSRRALRRSLRNGEVKGCGDAPGIADTTRRCADEARSLLCIVLKAHLRALAVSGRVVESERQATENLCKRLCPRIPTSRAAPKEGYCFLQRQHVERDLIGQLAPVREPRRDEYAHPGGWQKV